MTPTLPQRAPVTPGRVFAVLLLIAALLWTAPAQAQLQSQSQSQAQSQPRPAVPDENTLARLVWSTMVALDNANRTNNYSVVHDLGSPAFQRRNPPRQLAANFSALRDNRVDVGRAVLTSPTYYIPPQITDQGLLRLRGGFDYRPKSIRFDLLYGLQGGGWRITAMSVVEMDAGAPR